MAVVATAIFAVKLFPAEASLLSVSLAALLTVESVGRLVTTRPRHPVRFLTLRIGALFVGAVLGYSLLAMLLPRPEFQAAFARQLSYAGTAERGFGDFGPLLLANLYVLAFFFLIAFGFRKGGVMIAVAWNASVWGAVFGSSASGFGSLGRTLAIAGPHMVIEAVAYIVAGLAGVLLGRAVLRSMLANRGEWVPLLRLAGAMLGIALTLVVVGALWEALVANRLLKAWS